MTKNVFEAGKILNTLKNKVAAACMEVFAKEGKSFREAKKIADEAFKTCLLLKEFQTDGEWANFFVNYLKERGLGLSEKSLDRLGKQLVNFGLKEKMSFLARSRVECESMLKTQKGRMSKETVERFREILFDLMATHL